jgi:hypothetical protein
LFHPSLDYWDGIQNIQLPAIVFIIRDENNKIKGLQRVYLNDDGSKANIDGSKRVIGTIKQNAIKFGKIKDELHLAEGPETAIAIYKAIKSSVWCCINATNLLHQLIPKTVSKVHIWADKDRSETGQREAIKAADKYLKDGFEVFIHYPPSEIEQGAKSVDWLDEFNNDPETLKQDYCKSIPYPWKNIKKLGATSSVSVDFSLKLIPIPLRGWINEVSELMNVRPEIVTIPMIIALSSLIGRQVAIRPKKHDFTFEVIPNLWGAVVADPGSKKSPAVNMALAPINELVKGEKEKFKDALKEFEPIEQRINLEIDSLNKRYNSKGSNKITAQELVEETQKFKDELEEQRPVEKRYITNDSTIEKLVEILRDNPNGLMISKDELVGWLKSFDKKGREEDRPFFLSSWAGNQVNEVDRIGRGNIYVPSLCISIFGSIVPSVLNKYLNEKMNNMGGDDGLMDRIQLLIHPESLPFKEDVDRIPDTEKLNYVARVFKELDSIDDEKYKLQWDNHSELNYLQYDSNAQTIYKSWATELEIRLSSDDIPDHIKGHLSKYRSLIPSLSLIFHLVDQSLTKKEKRKSEIGVTSVKRSIAWAKYLEKNLNKVYGNVIYPELSSAMILYKRIHDGKLTDKMTVRDICRKNWSKVGSKKDDVLKAIKVLSDHSMVRIETINENGNYSQIIHIHPELLQKSTDTDDAALI